MTTGPTREDDELMLMRLSDQDTPIDRHLALLGAITYRLSADLVLMFLGRTPDKNDKTPSPRLVASQLADWLIGLHGTTLSREEVINIILAEARQTAVDYAETFNSKVTRRNSKRAATIERNGSICGPTGSRKREPVAA